MCTVATCSRSSTVQLDTGSKKSNRTRWGTKKVFLVSDILRHTRGEAGVTAARALGKAESEHDAEAPKVPKAAAPPPPTKGVDTAEKAPAGGA